MLTRKSPAITFVICCLAMLLLPVVGDSQDNSSTQVGYVVVTPTSGDLSSLVVFETFGEKRGDETTQAAVLPAELTTDAVVFASASRRLSRDLGLAIVNPNSAPSRVTMRLLNENGNVVLGGTRMITILGRTQTAQFLTELFAGDPNVPEDITGTLTIESTLPVAVLGLRFRGANFSTIPITNLSSPAPLPDFGGGVGGANAVLLPQFAAGGGWASEIVLANSSATIPLRARVDIFRQNGSPMPVTLNGQTLETFQNLPTIRPNGVFVLAPRNSLGDSDF